MGTHLDMRRRHTNARVDGHVQQTTVKHARQLVFEKGAPLTSKRLNDVLGNFSGIPTLVSPNAPILCVWQ
jgi:hypothetical protein